MQANKRIVETRIGQQCTDMVRRGVGDKCLLGVEREDRYFTFGVDTDKLVGAKLEKFGGCFSRQVEDGSYSSLTEDINLAASKLGVTCADR